MVDTIAEQLADLMIAKGLDRIEFMGAATHYVLTRPPSLILAEYAARQPDPDKAAGEEPVDDLTRLRTMTEDERDAALALAPLPRAP